MAQIIDKTILNTLVHLVREAPWGPTRQALEVKAVALRAGGTRAGDWQADIHEFAAAVRFPREDDSQVQKMTGYVKEEIRATIAGDHFRPNDARSEGVRIALQAALAGMSAEDLRTLQIVVTSEIVDERAAKQAEATRLFDLIDMGEERPIDVTEERWSAAVRSYNHQMTLENTPDEFLYPDRDAGDFDWNAYADDEPEPEEVPERKPRMQIARATRADQGGYSM